MLVFLKKPKHDNCIMTRRTEQIDLTYHNYSMKDLSVDGIYKINVNLTYYCRSLIRHSLRKSQYKTQTSKINKNFGNLTHVGI